MNKQNRGNSFNIVTYNDEEVVKEFVKTCNKWAYAIHDKDETDTHIHIVCTFVQAKSFNSVRKLMGGEQNTLIQELTDSKKAYEYLTHKNDPEKYQYDESIIKSNDPNHFIKEANDRVYSNYEFVDDILNEDMTTRELGYKYGRDYMKNMKAYDEFAKRVKMEENYYKKIHAGHREYILTVKEFILNECTKCPLNGRIECTEWDKCMRYGKPNERDMKAILSFVENQAKSPTPKGSI